MTPLLLSSKTTNRGNVIVSFDHMHMQKTTAMGKMKYWGMIMNTG